MASREVFHFDKFTLDVQERRLMRGTEAVRLSPKAYDVLVALVQQRGRLVTKDELLKRLWPKLFVEEGSLNVYVSALRKALGEDARRPAHIETVARSGRFIAAVRCDPTDEKSSAPSAITRSVELYELGRPRPVSPVVRLIFRTAGPVDAFRSAIEIDPTYAPAHAGLARARCVEAAFHAVPHQEAFTEAKASALRALAMDSASADAQVALGTVLFLSEWD
jgi:DNA-binding winged helix-turn-helix (wHTH) protein